MSKVRFNVPVDFRGAFPSDGATVASDISLVGYDETIVKIKGGVNIVYTGKPIPFFEGDKKRGSWLYQFTFPDGTTVNPSTSQYTTPTKTTYSFTGTTDHHISEGVMIRNMMDGTVIIKPPAEPTGVTESSPYTPTITGKTEEMGKKISKGLDKGIDETKEASKQINTLVDNAVLLESSIAGKMESIFNDKQSPFYTIALIVYKVAMDLFVVIIFWILFISIWCWLKIPAEYIYPTKVQEYPYVYYKKDGKGAWVTNQKGDHGQLCKPIDPEEVLKNTEKQNVTDLKTINEKLGPEDVKFLKIIYPAMLDRKDDNIPTFSKMVLEKCAMGEPCTMDYLIYFVGILCLTNYVYCSTVVGAFHSAGKLFTEKVIDNLPAKFTMVIFAAVLYYLFLTVEEINKTVVRMFKIEIKEGVNVKTKMQEHFYRLLVSILSVIVSIAIPLITILIVTCLLSTIYILCKTCLFPCNFAVLFISFITLFFSMSQYIIVIKSLLAYMDPLGLLERIYVKEINIQTIASFLGITVPILFGFVYGGKIAYSIFFNFFQFIKIEKVIDVIKRSASSVVMVGLLLLLFHVKADLGNMFFFLTIVIVILVGLYMLTKTS